MEVQWPILSMIASRAFRNAAKVDDLATRHAFILAVAELVGTLAGRENNVTSGEEDSSALVTFAEIVTPRSFEVREASGAI